MISNYSFFRVNENTVPLAPPEAMQFGQTLKRLLQQIHRAKTSLAQCTCLRSTSQMDFIGYGCDRRTR